MPSLLLDMPDTYVSALTQYTTEKGFPSELDAAAALLNETLRKLFFTYRSQVPKQIKPSRPVGRPPLDLKVKQSRRIYAELSEIFFNLRMRIEPAKFEEKYAPVWKKIETLYADADLDGLIAMAKERPW